MNYAEALAYLYSLTNFERVALDRAAARMLNLERMNALLAYLGNPHQRYRTIHVAGTKGKGSTSAMLAACLQQLGARVGLYTSPHLSSFRERIRVNGEMITKEALAALTTRLREAVARVPGVTTFEAATALGFAYFAEREVDWAVIEVGLGGRLDATNVIMPAASVITSISYDHQDVLGHTLTEIASEKCGIIKPGVPVVSQAQHPEAMAVIEQRAQAQAAPLTLVGRHWRWQLLAAEPKQQTFALWRSADDNGAAHHHDLDGEYTLGLLGKHQIENAATAVATLDVIRSALRESGFALEPSAIRAGLRAVHWPARFEVLRTAPPLVVDSAHNADSAQKLASALAEIFPGNRWVFVFSTLRDKDTIGMIHALQPLAARWVMTAFDHPRASDAASLCEAARALGADAEVRTLDEGVRLVLESELPVCVFGSVAFAGRVRTLWSKWSGVPLACVEEDELA
ncbi:MAG: folylpolyglutamate synthase/dihydrofolate synthase family protein [Anaerolineae bacterium]|nr:folylpolyglutamate synthase/dihydrofolate synthase family protein [Anaerolineae bacterium]